MQNLLGLLDRPLALTAALSAIPSGTMA